MEIPKIKTGYMDFLSNINRIMRSEVYHMMETNEVIQRETGSECLKMYSREVQETGSRIISLMNDVLAYSDFRGRMREMTSERYEMRDVLQELLSLGKSFSREYGVEFTLEADEELPGALYGADRGIVQVLLHLLDNVMRYTSDQGVRMIVRQLDQRADQVLLAAAIMEQATAAAYDGKMEQKSEDPGSCNRTEEELDLAGLGLLVTQKMSDQIGGNLVIRRINGAGYYEFTMWQKTEAGQFLGDWSQLEKEEEHEKQWNIYAPECRILMVDSSQGNCQIVSSLLKRSGIQVDSCTTGQQCLAEVTREKYHIIFLNCHMPDMNGEKLLWFMHEVMRIHVPVIAMEDRYDENTEKYYIDRGFSGILLHPITWYQLQQLLLRHLPGELVQKTERRDMGLDMERICQLQEHMREQGIELSVGMKYVAGDICQYRTMAELFRQEAGQQMADIQRNSKLGNFDALEALFRNAAGKAKALGALDLYHTIMVVERRGAVGDCEYVETTMPVLYLLWKRAVCGMEYLLHETQQCERRKGQNPEKKEPEETDCMDSPAETTEELMEHALYYIANLYPKKARGTLRVLKQRTPDAAELLDQIMTMVGNFEYDEALSQLQRWREEYWKHGKRQNSCD